MSNILSRTKSIQSTSVASNLEGLVEILETLMRRRRWWRQHFHCRPSLAFSWRRYLPVGDTNNNSPIWLPQFHLQVVVTANATATTPLLLIDFRMGETPNIWGRHHCRRRRQVATATAACEFLEGGYQPTGGHC